MGNALVSGSVLPLDGSVPGSALALLWLGLVLWAVLRLVVVEPWGSGAAAGALIRGNEQRRLKRFDQARARAEDLDERVRDSILALDFGQLRQSLQQDKFGALTVLKAFTWKALRAQEELNCLIDFLLEAFDKAEALDAKFGGKPDKPPLFGLPFSVKGNFYVKGYDCTLGLTKFLGKPRNEDCTLVSTLEELGAVPFVLTNVPQCLLSFVCSNSVYGTTKNPLDPRRTPGGSSGGEAALLAYGGSAFATGSDLAGSLRIPSLMCGLVSLKPTQDRVTVRHASQGVPGRGRLALAYGFITRTVDQQVELLGQVLQSDALHRSCPTAVPLPLKRDLVEQVAQKRLRIGFFDDDGFLAPAPGCARVVRETVEKLKAQGHELVRFRVPSPEQAAELCYKSIMTDGGTFLCDLFKAEPVDPYMTSFVRLISLPLWLRSLASHALRFLSPQAAILSRSHVTSVEQLRQNQEQVDLYQERWLDQWNELALDALVCPAFCVPAVEHHWPSFLGACGFATALFNMINFPSGVVPTGHWTEQDDRALDALEPGRNFVLKFVRDASRGSRGLPLAVQVATRPYEEEQCLGVMKLVEGLWKGQ